MKHLSLNCLLTALLSLALLSSVAYTQASAKLLMSRSANQDQLCYDVSLSYEGNQRIMIASQNYRFYYSSETLSFDETTSGLLLPDETYTYRLVQHASHVDGSKVGKFGFDKDLGFINASVILNNTNSLGSSIDRLAPEAQLIQLCFDQTAVGDKHIIPARKEVTEDYGRAYIDVSYVDEDGVMRSIDFSTYKDIHLKGK